MSLEKIKITNILYLNSLETKDYANNIFLKNEMQKFIDNNNIELSSHLFDYLLYKQLQTKANSDSTINNSICIISENYLNTPNIPKLSLKKLTLIPYKTDKKWAIVIFFNLSKCLKSNDKIMTKLITPFNTDDSLKLKQFLTIISKNLSLNNSDYNLDTEKFTLDNKYLSSIFIFNMLNELLDKKDFMESFDYINKIYENGSFNLHLFNEKDNIIEIINEYSKHTTDQLEKTITDNNTIDNDNDEYEDKLSENKISDLAKNTVDDLFNIAYEQNSKKKESENLEELTKNTVDDIMNIAFSTVKQAKDEKNSDDKKNKIDEMAKNAVDEIIDFAFGESPKEEKENEDVDKVAKSTVDDIFEFAFNDTLKSKTSENSSNKDSSSNTNENENIKNAVDSLIDLTFSQSKTSENKNEEKKEEISVSKNTIDDFLDSVMIDVKKDVEEKKPENDENKKEHKEKKKKKKPKRFHLKTKSIDTRIVIIEEAEKESSSGEENVVEDIVDNGYGYDAIISQNKVEDSKEESPLKPVSIGSETDSEANNLNKTELSEEILYDDNKVLKAKDFIQNENNDVNNINNNDNIINNVNNNANNCDNNDTINKKEDNEKKFADNKENININNSSNNKKEIINNDNLNNSNNPTNDNVIDNDKLAFENISRSIEPRDSVRRKLSFNPLNRSVDLNIIRKNALSPKSLRHPLKDKLSKVTIYNSVKRTKNEYSDILNNEKEPQDCKIPRDNKRNQKTKDIKIESIEKCLNKEPNDVIKISKSSILNNPNSLNNEVNIKKSNISKSHLDTHPLKIIYKNNIEKENNRLRFRKIFGVDENYPTSATENNIEEENEENKLTKKKSAGDMLINNKNKIADKSKSNKTINSKLEKIMLRKQMSERSPINKPLKYGYYYGYTYSSDFNFNDIENLKEYDMCSIM